MSEHDFISLNIQLGSGNRLTISTSDVDGMNKFLNDLNMFDEIDPESVSPLNDILTHVQTINAAVLVKFPATSGGAGNAGNPTPVAPANTVGQSCEHGPMTYREGIAKSGPNVGNPYKLWFCPAPRGAKQCRPIPA